MTHHDPVDVFRQLSAEGTRRIDAFVFELIFRRRLNKIVGNTSGLTVSFGWHLGYNKYGLPAYWFRLLDEDGDWNTCDDAMLAKLAAFRIGRYDDPVNVIRVKYDEPSGTLVASSRAGMQWVSWKPLTAVLDRLPSRGEPVAPKPMDNTSPQRAIAAFAWLTKEEFRHELRALSIQRRFMNCLLRPYLGRDGTDLDAVVLTEDGQLCTIEFKRKYPSVRRQVFGLDEFPHVRTVRTMDRLGIRNLHIMLVSPVWNKNESPVAWLSEKTHYPNWTWLAACLKGEDFPEDVHCLHTSGEDSGQRKGERDQASIKWEKIYLLNEGIRLSRKASADLVKLMTHGIISDAVRISYNDLFSRKKR